MTVIDPVALSTWFGEHRPTWRTGMPASRDGEAERGDLPSQLAQLPALEAALAKAEVERHGAAERLEQHEQQARRERRNIENAVIADAQVVATTLTMLTLKPALTADRYDHVIVDEALVPVSFFISLPSASSASCSGDGTRVPRNPAHDHLRRTTIRWRPGRRG